MAIVQESKTIGAKPQNAPMNPEDLDAYIQQQLLTKKQAPQIANATTPFSGAMEGYKQGAGEDGNMLGGIAGGLMGGATGLLQYANSAEGQKALAGGDNQLMSQAYLNMSKGTQGKEDAQNAAYAEGEEKRNQNLLDYAKSQSGQQTDVEIAAANRDAEILRQNQAQISQMANAFISKGTPPNEAMRIAQGTVLGQNVPTQKRGWLWKETRLQEGQGGARPQNTANAGSNQGAI